MDLSSASVADLQSAYKQVLTDVEEERISSKVGAERRAPIREELARRNAPVHPEVRISTVESAAKLQGVLVEGELEGLQRQNEELRARIAELEKGANRG